MSKPHLGLLHMPSALSSDVDLKPFDRRISLSRRASDDHAELWCMAYVEVLTLLV